MSINFKLTALGAVSAAMLVTAAQAASPTLYGGGATLPANAYVGDSWLSFTHPTPPSTRLSNPADLGSLFGEYTAIIAGQPTVSYCQTGSGNGKRVHRNSVSGGPYSADIACTDYANPATPKGFSAPSGQLRPHFAATDSPYSQSEYTEFTAQLGATKTEPFQIPSIVGAIALVYNNPDLSEQLTLNENQICKIFSGTTTTWKQLIASLPAKPIKVVFRSDGSGTSFAFSNHLSKVCGSLLTNGQGPANITGFVTTDTFTNAYPGNIPGELSASGNGGVVDLVKITDGAIGYGEASNSVSAGVSYAKVKYAANKGNGQDYAPLDPIINLPKVFPLPAGSVVSDQVITGVDGNGRPTLAALSPAASVPGCLVLVKPDAYAAGPTRVRQNDLAVNYNDYAGYPILAVTYLLGYYSGNATDTANLRKFFNAPFSENLRPTITTVGKNPGGTGFQFLSNVDVNGSGAPIFDTIKNCIKN